MGNPTLTTEDPTDVPTYNQNTFTALSADLLRTHLLPPLQVLLDTTPESIPFREAVDPVKLDIPDYFDIVKRPMDLNTIKKKLEAGDYADPWLYVDDVWQVFENAWSYNKRASLVYRFATKLSQMFEQIIDEPMQAIGLCCGRKYTFNPKVLHCYSRHVVTKDTNYYSYQNSFLLCKDCFASKDTDTLKFVDENSITHSVKKKEFTLKCNNKIQEEPFVTCSCGRKLHHICVRYLPPTVYSLSSDRTFFCSECHKKNGTLRSSNPFKAVHLPRTRLDRFIEDRVRQFLARNGADSRIVHIRVVSIVDRYAEVKPETKAKFVPSKMFDQFPYRAKALFAFEEIDGVDVCFFGMTLQEYGSECPPPNNRRLYIAYLDSVQYFQPKELRTDVYHEIILGYLAYAKKLGFAYAHIWACPPTIGDDYIFHAHPPHQKIPKHKRMLDWYKRMLTKAKRECIIYDFKDILQQSIQDQMTCFSQIPYFEGDFWPNTLEDTITEDEHIVKTPGTSRDPSPKQRKTSRKPKLHSDDPFTSKIFALLTKHKNVFFIIQLHSPSALGKLPVIQDPDPLIHCDLMDGRDGFILLAQERNLEFSSLRRAKYATLALLYELQNATFDRFTFNCDICKVLLEDRYHCVVCPDFDLCGSCWKRSGHDHHMRKIRPSDDERVQIRKIRLRKEKQTINENKITKENCRPSVPSKEPSRKKRDVAQTKVAPIKLSPTSLEKASVDSPSCSYTEVKKRHVREKHSQSRKELSVTPRRSRQTDPPLTTTVIPDQNHATFPECTNSDQRQEIVSRQPLKKLHLSIPEHKWALLRGYNSIEGTSLQIQIKRNGGLLIPNNGEIVVRDERSLEDAFLNPVPSTSRGQGGCGQTVTILESNTPVLQLHPISLEYSTSQLTTTRKRASNNVTFGCNQLQESTGGEIVKRSRQDLPEHQIALLRGYNSIYRPNSQRESSNACLENVTSPKVAYVLRKEF